ncbi:MAG: DNA polymerase III subunit alpha, partial [Curtobacterium sp.]
MTSPFAHLHVHTEHSALDGLTKMRELFAFVADAGMNACAVTDHGTLSGIWAAQDAADRAGVKLLPGCEFYLAYGSRFEPGSEDVIADHGDDSDDAEGGRMKTRRYQHLTVIAITPAGWRSLVRLRNESERTKVTVAGKGYPLIDLELLAENRDGIVVLTGCLGGPVLGPLARGDESTCRKNLTALQDAVGSENLYVEIMSHGIDTEDAVLPRLAAIAGELSLTLVATNDSHYLREVDAPAHDAWLALRTKKQITDTNRYRFTGTGYHVKTEAEMRQVRPEQWWQDAVTAAGAVADRCVTRVVPQPDSMLPEFPTPQGFTSNRDYLIDRITAGAKARWGDPLPDAVRQRLTTEFDVIMHPSKKNPDLSFDSYMLMVAEMIGWEQQQGGLVGAGRGSAPGSAIASSLDITALDPLARGLLFERFLEPGRADWPDIDTDFQKRRREAILDHLAEFWGDDRVVLIGAFAQAKSKRALRDAARVLGAGRVGDVLAKAVPIVDGGKPMSLARVTDEHDAATGEFRRLLARHGDDAEHTLALARAFEDTVAGLGIHACGVLVADRNLFDLIPLRQHKTTGRWIAEWDSRNVEQFGGVKLDVLALRNLDIVADAIDLIEEQTGERIDFSSIPDGSDPNDPRVQAAWRLLQDGQTAGIFQMESAPMAQLARDVRPTSMDDLSAVIALYRPGPLSAGMHTMYAARKNGAEQVDYSWLTTDPTEIAWIDSVLGETYGLIVYQEQMMRLAGIVAGFDAAERSKLRKAVGKKLKDLM